MHWLDYHVSKLARNVPALRILKDMGYRASNEKALDRLHGALTDGYLGMYTPCFDFRFDSRGFALALCEALGVREEAAEAGVAELEQELDEERCRFQPWIFMDTAFKRTSQPIFALATCESLRRRHLSDEFGKLGMDEQLAYVRALIHRHQESTGGKLALWGNVQRYLFWYGPQTALVFSTTGQVIGEEGSLPSRASIHLV